MVDIFEIILKIFEAQEKIWETFFFPNQKHVIKYIFYFHQDCMDAKNGKIMLSKFTILVLVQLLYQDYQLFEIHILYFIIFFKVTVSKKTKFF